MAHSDEAPTGPDFALGVPLASVPGKGALAGHVDGAPVLLARLEDGLHAVAGVCTHYGATLSQGLVVGDEIHCPWHHACFSLRTGAALKAPAFGALRTYAVELVDVTVYVRTTPAPVPAPSRAPGANAPDRIVIVGGGAAGYAAAERLRALGYGGALTVLSADPDAPYDRPNLSKDYLAGTAPEDWIPLQGPEFYAERAIELQIATEVAAIDPKARTLTTAGGARILYDALLIATGSDSRRLATPGFDRPNVRTLRSLGDARAIIATVADAKSVALVGAGFIGLEAAGALRARGLDVHVIAREAVPMGRVLGDEIGRYLVSLHQKAGVVFHFDTEAVGFDGEQLTLRDGTRVRADLVLVGAGAIPRVGLAKAAGMKVEDGIVVDEQLRTSIAGHYAAGDVARYPYRGELIRVEHWVHAERQGQAAAANLLGAEQAFDDVPYFWTHHQGVELRMCGHAAAWDDIRIEGSVPDGDFVARYFRKGGLIAAAAVGRDRELLEVEASF